MTPREPTILRGARAVSARRVFAETRIVGSRLVDELHALADEIDRARDEAAAERDNARREGYEQGVEQAAQLLFAATQTYDRALDAARDDALELAFRIAEQILCAALDRDAFPAVVAAQLAAVPTARTIAIRVCADDAASLVVSPIDGVDLRIVVDEALTRGDCVLETDRGTLDARLSMRLDALRRALDGSADAQ